MFVWASFSFCSGPLPVAFQSVETSGGGREEKGWATGLYAAHTGGGGGEEGMGDRGNMRKRCSQGVA
jgi:hypothetical protein